LKEKNSNKYATWFRWGRVGRVAGNNLMEFGESIEEAKSVFLKKFSDKTNNEFTDILQNGLQSFKSHSGWFNIRASFHFRC
jgi:hypothetical protein